MSNATQSMGFLFTIRGILSEDFRFFLNNM